MISISVGEGGLSRSEPNVRATCGIRPMVLCLMRSESEVEFKALGLRSAKNFNKEQKNRITKMEIAFLKSLKLLDSNQSTFAFKRA